MKFQTNNINLRLLFSHLILGILGGNEWHGTENLLEPELSNTEKGVNYKEDKGDIPNVIKRIPSTTKLDDVLVNFVANNLK